MAGPRDNPFKIIGGATPCPGGWLVLPGRLSGVTVVGVAMFVLPTLGEVLDYRPKFDFGAINIPFGYPEYPNVQFRRADADAREIMGWPRRIGAGRISSSANSWRAI